MFWYLGLRLSLAPRIKSVYTGVRPSGSYERPASIQTPRIFSCCKTFLSHNNCTSNVMHSGTFSEKFLCIIIGSLNKHNCLFIPMKRGTKNRFQGNEVRSLFSWVFLLSFLSNLKTYLCTTLLRTGLGISREWGPGRGDGTNGSLFPSS